MILTRPSETRKFTALKCARCGKPFTPWIIGQAKCFSCTTESKTNDSTTTKKRVP